MVMSGLAALHWAGQGTRPLPALCLPSFCPPTARKPASAPSAIEKSKRRSPSPRAFLCACPSNYFALRNTTQMAKDKSKKAAATSAASAASLNLAAHKKAIDPTLASLFATSVSTKISKPSSP